MGKDPKSSRRAPDDENFKGKPRAGRSCATSPLSTQSKNSGSNGERGLLNSVLRPHKKSGHFVTKVTRRKDRGATHRKCLDVMSEIEEEFRMALAHKVDEKAHVSQLVQQLRAEKAQETTKLQDAIAARENALAEGQRLQREVYELKQQVESTNAAMQNQVPWSDIQVLLYQTHGDLVSAITRFWNAIDAFQNRRLASYLPGSEVIHETWTEQCGPLRTVGHDALPGFSASGNPPLGTQQEPVANNAVNSPV